MAVTRPHSEQRYIHDGCRCVICTEAQKLAVREYRVVAPLRAMLRGKVGDEIKKGRNAEQAAARVLKQFTDDEARAHLGVFIAHEANMLVLSRGADDLPRSPEPVKKSGRWEFVAAMSKDPRQWPITTPRGRSITLGDCKAEDLDAIAEQSEGDARQAETWAKRLRVLCDELGRADVDRVSDLSREQVEAVMT